MSKNELVFGRFVPDFRVEQAPRLPAGRPPTRREVWERLHFLYYDLKGHAPSPLCSDKCRRKPEGVLEAMARSEWTWAYVYRHIFRGWRKQPDWVEGDPVISEAVPPDGLFVSGGPHTQQLYHFFSIAHNRKVAA